MNKYKETHETWNSIAFLYQNKFMNLDLYDETYDFFCNSITKKKSQILDIGCGPGNITKYLLSKRIDFDILGIDTSPNMITLAQKNNPTANFKIMDGRKIAELKTKFEGIICGFCLPYLSQSDGYRLINDSYNLLKKDGLIYLSFIEGEPTKSDYKIGNNGSRVFFHLYSINELTKKLIEYKFEMLKIYRVDYQKNESKNEVHTILIAKK